MISGSQQDDVSTVETSQWIPLVDIKEEPNRFLISADLPGMEPNKIDVHMEHNILAIKGERIVENKEEGKNFMRIERAKGTFHRRFTLPNTADGNNIKARYQNGVLEIDIPKREQAQARKINIEKID